MRSEKPICAPPRLSEVSPTSPLKKLKCSSDWRWPSLVSSIQVSSIWYLCARKKPICTPPRLSEVSSNVRLLKQFQCSYGMALSRQFSSVQISIVQDGIYAFGKAHMHSTLFFWVSQRRLLKQLQCSDVWQWPFLVNSLKFKMVSIRSETFIIMHSTPSLRSLPNVVVWNGSNVRLTDDGPLSSFQRKSSRAANGRPYRVRWRTSVGCALRTVCRS